MRDPFDLMPTQHGDAVAVGHRHASPLQGEDVIRESGVPFAVVRPTALTEEDAGAEVVVDQGDVLKVGSFKGGSAWRATCLHRSGLLCNEIAVY